MFIKDVNKNEILLPVIFSGNALKIATFINSTRGILKTVKIDFYKPKKKKQFRFTTQKPLLRKFAQHRNFFSMLWCLLSLR